MRQVVIVIQSLITAHPDAMENLARALFLALGILCIRVIRCKDIRFRVIMSSTFLTGYFYALVFLSLILFNIMIKVPHVGPVMKDLGYHNCAGLLGAFSETVWIKLSAETTQLNFLKYLYDILSMILRISEKIESGKEVLESPKKTPKEDTSDKHKEEINDK